MLHERIWRWSDLIASAKYGIPPIHALELYFLSADDMSDFEAICRHLPSSLHELKLVRPRILKGGFPNNYKGYRMPNDLERLYYTSATEEVHPVQSLCTNELPSEH